MGDGNAQGRGPHLLLYDGTCGFCHRTVRFVLARDRRATFHFAALQSASAARALAPFGGRPPDLTTFYLIEDYRSARAALRSRAGAALVVARSLGWPWRAASALRLLPRSWADAAYHLVARNRHAILGPADTCVVPGPEERARFLDAWEAEAP